LAADTGCIKSTGSKGCIAQCVSKLPLRIQQVKNGSPELDDCHELGISARNRLSRKSRHQISRRASRAPYGAARVEVPLNIEPVGKGGEGDYIWIGNCAAGPPNLCPDTRNLTGMKRETGAGSPANVRACWLHKVVRSLRALAALSFPAALPPAYSTSHILVTKSLVH
jgi:hypothetical protein